MHIKDTIQGVNNGLHNAEVTVQLIQIDNQSGIIRLENFKAITGPDLYLYPYKEASATDFIDLGRIKENIGNQNYPVLLDDDFSKHNQVLIWWKAFSVRFGNVKPA